MEHATGVGFVLVAVGFAAGLVRRGSPGQAARRGGPGDLPALLIGSGAVLLGGALAVRLVDGLLSLLDAASFDLSALSRGLAPVALGAAAVGLAGGFAAPQVSRWSWGLLVSLFCWPLAAALWVLLLVLPEGFEALAVLAREEAIDVDAVRRSIWQLLGVVTAYPVLALLGATGGAAAALALGRGRPVGPPHPEAPPVPGAIDEDETSVVGGGDTAALRFVRVGESWCHRVFDGDEELAFLEFRMWWRDGGFQWEGGYYRIAVGFLRTAYDLEWRGRPLARATTGLLGRKFRVMVGDRELSLRPRGALLPMFGDFLLEEAGERIGWVGPPTAHPAAGQAELPGDLPLPVRLFVIYLALVLWLRCRPEP